MSATLPFIRYLYRKETPFLSRTILVKNGQAEEAFKVLNRILGQEQLLDNYRRNKYYEHAYQTRKRVNFEVAKSLYNEDMIRKIDFLTRKNRPSPWPGCE